MKRIVLYGGSFNPFTIMHRAVLEKLVPRFDLVKIIPCGMRPDKETTNDIHPVHRAATIDLSTKGLPSAKFEIDYFDLENDKFTPNHLLEQRYDREGELWHVIGSDLIKGGSAKQSYIHRVWQKPEDVWNNLRFIIMVRSGYPLDPADLPPKHKIIRVDDGPLVSSESVRSSVFQHESYDHMVTPEVAQYIQRHGLYLGGNPERLKEFRIDKPRLDIYWDQQNAAASAAVRLLEPAIDRRDPNLIVVLGGDGTLLHTARNQWRRRIPIVGINFGHVGHNLNDLRDQLTPELFQRPMRLWHLPLLFVELVGTDGKRSNEFAFNDAFVSAQPGQSVWMRVKVDNEVKMEKLVGDGILVATPQGSTAYARSMGATPLRNDSRELVLVGNNIFYPTWKQARLSFSSKVQITNADLTGYRKLYAFADSKPFGSVRHMTVRASRFAAVELGFFPEYDPIKKLDRIQFPGK